MTAKPATLREIAARINAHLMRFEADPAINAVRDGGTRYYFWANAYPAGRYVAVVYVSYQGASNLTREQASQYLEALDSGFVGTHYEAARAAAKP